MADARSERSVLLTGIIKKDEAGFCGCGHFDVSCVIMLRGVGVEVGGGGGEEEWYL